MQGITKEYQMWEECVKVLKWIDININSWEFVAIMGPSGSWKSTLMNIIWMLDNQTDWEYHLEWLDIWDLKDSHKTRIRWEKIWFVFQNYSLIPRISTLKQVMIPLLYAWVSKWEAKLKAKKALEKVWLLEKLNNRPDELSWGQKQRVAIARALVVEPSIILADEPTWALDSKTWTEVMELFKELNNEWKTIILITHEKEIAENAKRIITVRDWLLT